MGLFGLSLPKRNRITDAIGAAGRGAGRLVETITPQNEQALRNSQANLARANQAMSQPAKYGVLRNQAVQRQAIRDNQPVKFNAPKVYGQVAGDVALNTFAGGVKRFGQSSVSTLLSPYSNRLADQERRRAERLLKPAYGNLYAAYGQDRRLGENQAEIEAGQADYALRTDPLNRSNIGVNDSTATTIRKVGAQGAEAFLDIATAGQGPAAFKAAKLGKTVKPSIAVGGLLGGAGNATYLAQQDNVTKEDIIKNLAIGVGTGVVLPALGAVGGKIKSGKTTVAPKQKPKVQINEVDLQRRNNLVAQLSEAERKGKNTAYFKRKIDEIDNKKPSLLKDEGGYIKTPGRDPIEELRIQNANPTEALQRADGLNNAMFAASEVKQKLKRPNDLKSGNVNETLDRNALRNKLLMLNDERGSVLLPGGKEPALPVVKPKAKTKVELNTKNLDLTPEQKAIVKADTTQDINRLSNKEVQSIADSAGIDTKALSRSETKKVIAEQLNLRRKLVETHKQADAALKAGDLEGRARLLEQAAQEGRTSRGQGTDVARQLAARRILADELKSPQQKVFNLLDTAGVDPKDYSKRFASVDFNDTEAVVGAYRDLVPAKFGDWLDKYRYTNMLSSPLTHIVNVTSNLTGSFGIAPLQKLYEGGVDAVRAAVTGGERTRFASEGVKSLEGTFKSLPDAMKAFGDVMSGRKALSNPDFTDVMKNAPLAVGGAKGTADQVLSFIPRLLEASDQFSMKLTTGGEAASLGYRAGKGVDVADIAGQATENATYRAFRQQLGKQGQGHLLETLDFIPKVFLNARNNKNPIIRNASKYTLPFVTTPVNLFKQGIEYSPLGVTTLWGNPNKTTQVAKALMGTTVVATVGGLAAANDGLTFSEPSNAKERDAFRAEGKQPYAIKIGNKWVGYSKLHPAIAFNLALTAAVKDGLDKGTIDETGADKVMRIGGGMMGYLSDQSYMKSVGDFVNVFTQKDGLSPGSAITGQTTNTVNQLVPFKSMTSWIGRMIDPTQRKVDSTTNVLDQVYQGIVKDIPGLNENVPARKNPYTGEDIKNDNPILNSFVPTRITNDRGYGNTTGLNVEQRMAQKEMPEGDRKAFRSEVMYEKGVEKLSTKEKEKFKLQEGQGTKQLKNGKFYTKVGDEYKTFDTKEDADIAVFKEEFSKSDKKSATNGDTYFYKNKAGKVVTKPKVQYEFEQVESKTNLAMDRATAKKDLNGWFKAADEKYAALEAKKQLYDPETEADEINKIILQQENLMEKADKYASYGGFTKGRSGGGGGGSDGGFNTSKYMNSISAGSNTSRPKVSVSVKQKKVAPRYAQAKKPTVSIKKSKV